MRCQLVGNSDKFEKKVNEPLKGKLTITNKLDVIIAVGATAGLF